MCDGVASQPRVLCPGVAICPGVMASARALPGVSSHRVLDGVAWPGVVAAASSSHEDAAFFLALAAAASSAAALAAAMADGAAEASPAA